MDAWSYAASAAVIKSRSGRHEDLGNGFDGFYGCNGYCLSGCRLFQTSGFRCGVRIYPAGLLLVGAVADLGLCASSQMTR